MFHRFTASGKTSLKNYLSVELGNLCWATKNFEDSNSVRQMKNLIIGETDSVLVILHTTMSGLLINIPSAFSVSLGKR